MHPLALELPQRGVGIHALDLVTEGACLRLLIGDHPVARAPVDLERDARERQLPDVVVRAPKLVCGRVLRGRAAQLLAREPLQRAAAAQSGEVAVAAAHVGRRIERGGAREQVRMQRHQQERLLAAHRAAERVDPAPIDVDAVRLGDRRHPREVGDLAGRAPREPVQAATLTGRVDHREVALTGQVPPEEGVLLGPHPTPVRRDDEPRSIGSSSQAARRTPSCAM